LRRANIKGESKRGSASLTNQFPFPSHKASRLRRLIKGKGTRGIGLPKQKEKLEGASPLQNLYFPLPYKGRGIKGEGCKQKTKGDRVT